MIKVKIKNPGLKPEVCFELSAERDCPRLESLRSSAAFGSFWHFDGSIMLHRLLGLKAKVYAHEIIKIFIYRIGMFLCQEPLIT